MHFMDYFIQSIDLSLLCFFFLSKAVRVFHSGHFKAYLSVFYVAL